jgi:Tol biopolymer transport system component
LIYSAKFSKDQLFIISLAPSQSEPVFVDGKDPAWNPTRDVVVFNGYDEGGANPGLWIMRTDGTERQRLTGIGSDQRPVWTPDGQSVVFMSKDRTNSNWEVYRISWPDGLVLQMTEDSHQDGLPTVSPDGKWVAFMSDRGGHWQLWYTSIDGGPAQLLGEISGQPIAWLEHGIQWVE